jgi:hypothetical protein
VTARHGPPAPPSARPSADGLPTGPHLDDAELVRWLDGEVASDDGDPAAGARLAAHAAACAACGARADLLRARQTRLTALLAEADLPAEAPPPDVVVRLLRAADARRAAPTAFGAAGRPVRRPPGGGARGGARLAAACALLAAAGLSAQPVRRWVAAQWTRLTAPVPAPPPATGPTRAPDLPQPATGVAPSTFTVTFALEPGSGPFTVAFDARPAGGTLRVTTDTARAAAGGRVRATATGATGDELLVLPAGLRVRNRPTSTADYAFVVPPGTGRVRLRFGAAATGGATSDTLLTLGAAGTATVPLAAVRASGPR